MRITKSIRLYLACLCFGLGIANSAPVHPNVVNGNGSHAVLQVRCEATSVAFSPNSKLLAVGYDSVDVFDLDGKHTIFHGTNVGGYICAIAWLDNERFVTSSADEDGSPGAYIVWNIRTGKRIEVSGEVPAGGGTMVAHGGLIIASGSYEDGGNCYVAFIDVIRAKVVRVKRINSDVLLSGPVVSGRIIETTRSGISELTWPGLRRVRTMNLPFNSGDVASVADGKRIFALVKQRRTESGLVVEIARSPWKIRKRIPARASFPSRMSASPSGRQLLVSGDTRGNGSDAITCEVSTLDNSGNWIRRTVHVDGAYISALAWSPNSKLYAIAVQDGSVTVRLASASR